MPPSECKECRANLAQIEETILCSGGCGSYFCIKCSNLKREETKLLNENDNIKWFCNECSLCDTNTKFIEIKHLIKNSEQSKIGKKEMKEIIEEALFNKIQQLKISLITDFNSLLEHNVQIKINQMQNDILAELTKTIENNNEKLSEVLSSNKSNSNNTNVNKMNYAQVAKQNENRIVIKPKDKAKNNKLTKVALKKVIEPTECHVTTVKDINNGGIVVQCKNKEACELVQKKVAEQIGDEYETEKTKDKREIKKIFKIVGLTERLSSERLVECITKQNSICEGKEFEVIKIFDNLSRREECFNALVETDVETFKNILKRKRLNIEWDSCVTMEYVRVYRCFKCLGFNHKASECFNKKACSKCGAIHDAKDCLSNVYNCVNCCELVQKKLLDADVHHSAFSKECPAFKRYLESKSRIRK